MYRFETISSGATGPSGSAWPAAAPTARSVGLFLLVTILCAALSVPFAGAGEVTTVEGVPHVANGAEPANGLQTLEMEEIWRVGGEDEEDVLLGIITRVLVDDDNNIYLLDQQLSEVQVFSPEGEHLNTLGGQGEGPGQLTRPADMLFMPDGTLGLVQIFPGKIVKVNLDNTPAGEFHPDVGDATAGGFLALVNCRAAGGSVVLSGVKISIDQSTGIMDRHYFLRNYAMDGSLVAPIYSLDRQWNFAGGFTYKETGDDFIWRRMDVGPDGRTVICKPRDEYQLSIYGPDGTLERVFEREYESWKRTPDVFEQWESIMQAQSAQFPPGTALETAEYEQDIEDLRVARDGSIWILPSRQMYEPAPGYFAVYDVFTPDGHFDRQVGFKCEGNPARDVLILTGGDYVFQVTDFWDAVRGAAGAGGDGSGGEEEAEPMEVICYRLK